MGHDMCTGSVSGIHNLPDTKGRCSWCNRKVYPIKEMGRITEVSELTEAYRQFYDPDWEGSDAR